MLALVLFILYFSVACIFVSNPNAITKTAINTPAPNDYYCQVKEMFDSFEEVVSLSEPTPKPILTSESTLLCASINVDNLKVLQARKLAKALFIRQKINGKTQPLSWLKAQIKAKLDSADLEKQKELLELISA